MSQTLTVPRALGGTLLITYTPAPIIAPPVNAVLYLRSGKSTLTQRSGKADLLLRSGKSTLTMREP